MVKITPLIASILVSMVAAQGQQAAPSGTDVAFPSVSGFPGTQPGFGGQGGFPDASGSFPAPTGGFAKGNGGFGHLSGFAGPAPTGLGQGFGGDARPSGGPPAQFTGSFGGFDGQGQGQGQGQQSGAPGPQPTGSFNAVERRQDFQGGAGGNFGGAIPSGGPQGSFSQGPGGPGFSGFQTQTRAGGPGIGGPKPTGTFQGGVQN